LKWFLNESNIKKINAICGLIFVGIRAYLTIVAAWFFKLFFLITDSLRFSVLVGSVENGPAQHKVTYEKILHEKRIALGVKTHT